jgi:cysteine desulfurase/selenocysteine lyase
VSSLKKRFPIFSHHPDLCYLDSAATTHKPQEVIDALSDFYASEYGTVHRGIYALSRKATELYNGAREKVRHFLHAQHVDEIIFTRGTTDAINLVARSYGKMVLRPGDEVLISEMEHHSNIVPWQMLCEETGAILRYIPVSQEGELLWKGMITSKTKIVSIAHISNVLGTINPIQEIGKQAHEKGAVLVVDGAQGAPHLLVDVQALGCDFYAFSGHKCYGPTGIGILYGKRALLEKMPPIEGGGDMIERVELTHSSYQKPPLRFEAGTPIIASAIALKTALEFMIGVGREQIAAHGKSLLEYATSELAKISALRVLGTASKKGPILSFSIEGIHPLDVATFLDLEGIALRSGHLCAQPILRKFGLESCLRVSFGLYNTVEDVDRVLAAFKKACRSLS